MAEEKRTAFHLHIFAADAGRYLEQLRSGLDALEGGADASAAASLLKPAHALKGNARMLGFEGIADLCHEFEEATARVQREGFSDRAAALATLRNSVDVLERMIALAISGSATPADVETLRRLEQISRETPEPASPLRARLRASVSIQSSEPDKASDRSVPSSSLSAGPLSARLRRNAAPTNDADSNLPTRLVQSLDGSAPDADSSFDLDALMTSLKRLHQDLEASDSDLLALAELRGRLVRRSSAAADGKAPCSGEDLAAALGLVERSLQRAKSTRAAVRHLERRIRRLRFCRVDSVFGHLAVAARALAQERGKNAICVLHGGHLEVERELLRGLSGPIMHLIGNAIHHGLEDSSIRRERGKPELGTISLSWENLGRAWRIRVADDGAGIDTRAVWEKARREGLLPDDLRDVSDDDRIAQLIFIDGITTSSSPSVGGGRGIGLDMVRTDIGKLHGQIRVTTRGGFGTTFTIDVPRPRPPWRGRTPSPRPERRQVLGRPG